ncbi:hypothetical protein J2741_000072 [Methanolinea mesophila]|uniref:hypothetical protein n=1 Tax=Methanolinea mesophila TaxID=547055 RepID=UPI001AE10203|nr:hypothetical protein [Methanolinea mesophila]MBP1927525.1 hypothetical protein [Methanolinea mesophila]
MNEISMEILEKLKKAALKRCEERIVEARNAPGPPKKELRCGMVRNGFTSSLKKQHGLL